MSEFTNMTKEQLNQALVKWDKKLDTIKTQGGLWVCEMAIKSIRSEMDLRK